MSPFKTAGHLVSWARLCPRMAESAGKVLSTRSLKSSAWVKTLLIQAAWCAIRTRKSYFRAQYFRLKSRRGAKKAIGAVAASLLTTVYHMIRTGQPYCDLGSDHFDRTGRENAVRRSLARLRQLGYRVTLERQVA